MGQGWVWQKGPFRCQALRMCVRALGRLRRRNTEIKRPGFHSQQPPKFKEWSHWGWGYGVGEGVLMGARDKGSSLPIPTLVPERKQIQYQPLNLSFSLSLLRLFLGVGESLVSKVPG